MSDSNDSVEMAPDERFLRLPEVLSVTGLSRAELYLRAKTGEFPTARKYTNSRITFWLLSEIREWQRTQLAAAA